ncbi:PREDICTED: actin-related protein 5-like [Amphimedon queenslandica]|nr:PREDICTED: actin-related protein 5-like [Amphimedon queenslandica]|eukprot:XP_019849311.1 PREDICTED: actin-related protein 5-like [Amphimedon queenslandica]
MTDYSSDLYWFSDSHVTPDLPQDQYYYSSHCSANTPIIVDNGSWKCRAGWGSLDQPQFVFRSLMARMRGKRGENDFTLVGNDIGNIESLRSSIKNQFDRNVVTNFSNQEQIFDHLFTLLGLSNESSVHHPVLVSEPPCNPPYCRNIMSELLFECYQVPSVSYGIDALYNLYHTLGGRVSDALVINCGYQTTHVCPVLDGLFQPDQCKRINVGGWHISSYLQRLLQLRYQALQSLISLTRAEELVHTHCFVAERYIEMLSKKDWPKLTVQLPYVAIGGGGAVGGASIDLAKQEEKVLQRRERARQHLLRLSQTKREEKIASLEGQLEKLIHLQQLAAVMSDPEEYRLALEESGFNSLESVLKEISQIEEVLEIERSRLLATQQKMQEAATQAVTGGGESNEPKVDSQWLQVLQTRKKEILEQKRVRNQQKQEYSKRRSAASQDRMRIISQLAEDNSGKKSGSQPDTFGMNDDDWNIYRAIHKPGTGGGSDSEKEEAELAEINKVLQHHEPVNPAGTSSHYQLQLGVELCRASEVLFQPSMIGLDQCGLIDVIEAVLSGYTPDVQNRLMNCVFVCGGSSQLKGMEERLSIELTAARPFQSTFTILPAADKLHGSWRGAALYSSDESVWFTRSRYMEEGIEYRIEHLASNRCT